MPCAPDRDDRVDQTVLAHITLTARNADATAAFYDAVFGALQWVRLAELVDEEEAGDGDAADPPESVGWGPAGGEVVLWLVPGTADTTHLHIRLNAQSRPQVETFWAQGQRHGGTGHAAPRRWTLYRRGEYGAMVRDPLGNIVEVVAPE